MQQVLVLNASYEPLNVCSLRRAHVLVFKGKAEVIEELDRPLRSATDTYRWPHVIRLVHYVRVPRMVQRKISRRALFARDGWRCVYCGTSNGRLTLDHVIPRSKGGDSTWENVVTREYHPWSVARIVIDTSGEMPTRSVERLLAELRAAGV